MGIPTSDRPSPETSPAAPELSVVVPCFQCADSIGASIEALTSYLEGTSLTWEVILVDDGSDDDTGDVLRAHADGVRVVALHLARNRGKGRAVATGMLEARGRCRIFTDADLPYALDAISRCADKVRAGSPAVFGNRLLVDSDARVQPWVRQGFGKVVQLLVGILIGRRDVDTQCGFKGFAGPVADIVFRDLRIDGFLFDVEVALVLTRAGLELDFVPVTLVNHDRSTVHLLSTGTRTVVEGWQIARMRTGHRKKVAALRALYRRSKT